MLPFGVPLDTKTRELQKRVSNKYLANNVLLYKIGITPSPVCSFGEEVEETLAHLVCLTPMFQNFGMMLLFG